MMNLQSFFKKNKEIIGLIVTVAVVIGVVYLIQYYSSSEYFTQEEDNTPFYQEEEYDAEYEEAAQQPQNFVEPTTESGSIGANAAPVPDALFASDSELSPIDLLPKSQVASEFEDQFPVGTGDVTAKNFLTAGYNVGINTVSSSLRNANLQLRSDPFIPVETVSPWMNSTVLPDLNRKQFEIGTA